jgi:hypothetical protein
MLTDHSSLTLLTAGEGHFDDKPSGTATPTADETRKGKAKSRPSTKKKTAKQRLAIADGGGD